MRKRIGYTIALFSVIIAVAVCCVGCMAGAPFEPDSVNDNSTTTAKNEVQLLYDNIIESVNISHLTIMKDSYIKSYYGLDTSIFAQYVFAVADASESVDTIILVNCHDDASLENCRSVFLRSLSDITAEAEDTEFVEIIEDAVVGTHGSLLYYVISPQVDDIIAIINES